jgi:hypothetical protein
METQQLEARVLGIADAVLDGRQVEDDRVELKAQWPAAERKTARQIAGHANASGGEPILWIIGLDEKAGTFGQTSGVEPSNWWGHVSRHFVEVAPELVTLRVPIAGGHDVIVLRFATDRAPYLVSVAGGGQVENEVPWREGNSTRTARRHEMIRSVVAEASVPTLELIGASVDIDEFVSDPRTGEYQGVAIGDIRVRAALDLFLSAQGDAYLPQHRQELSLRVGEATLNLSSFNFTGSYRFDGTTESGMRRRVPAGNVSVLGASGVEVTGPGDLRLRSETVFRRSEAEVLVGATEIALHLRLPVDRTDRATVLDCALSLNRSESEPPPPDSWEGVSRFDGARSASWWWY